MAVVIPPPGRLKETAQLLLELAGDVPEIVRTVGNGVQFDVPDELADLYHARTGAPEIKPVKRRGRPPRVDTEE